MQKTRATIVRMAEELFALHGYEETTVAEIALAADVSPATVFNYFPSKDDILFGDHAALCADFADWLTGRGESTSALEATREWVTTRRQRFRDRNSDRLHRSIIDASPALQAQERLRMTDIERELARAVARDLGTAPEDLGPRIVAAAATAVLLATLQHGTERRSNGDDPFARIDYGMAFLTQGFEAIRREPS
jgi:AcrR family transcriptional regulator